MMVNRTTTPRDQTEVLDLAEEPLDLIAVLVQEGTEGGHVLAVGHLLDVGPGPLLGQTLAPRVAVVGPIAQKGLPRSKTAERVVGGPAIVRLAFGDLERDGPALGIHQRVDLAR